MRGRILFADNIKRFLRVRSEFLKSSGFEVLPAHTIEEAERILKNEWIHLAILDIRLVDDDNDSDISGLILAKDEAYAHVPKIILTGFPTYTAVREALGPVLNGLPPAVAFLAKEEGSKAMIRAVEYAFTQYVRINWDLVIRRNERNLLSFPHLIALFESEVDNRLLSVRVGELEDLFRRLFYSSSQIKIDRLLAQREGGGSLVVFAYSEKGVEEQFVVTCGQKQSIINEDRLYESFVPKVTGQGSIVKRKTAETLHFAATAYALIGCNLEETTTFSEFYRDNATSLIITALDHLFEITLAPWYNRGRFREKAGSLNELLLECFNLDKDAFSQSELGLRMEDICQKALYVGLAELDYSVHKLTFYLADGSPAFYPNPLVCFSETQMILEPSVLYGTTHGQLNGNIILTDYQGRTWLIDFSHADQGPLLRDFISLESTIKFDLLTVPNVQVRYEMERHLLAVSRLDEEIDVTDLEPEVQKALQAIYRVRYHASVMIGCNLDAYLRGLLFYTISQLATYDAEVQHTRQELIPYLHSLMSAAMLCQKLLPPPPTELPPQALHSLWIDEANKEVWIESRSVQLTSQEFDLLFYLYQHRGQLCGRVEIAEHVLEAEYGRDVSEREKKKMEDTRLNSMMSRLRKKIEPTPAHPRYIINVRGEGYKLDLGNKWS